MHVSVQDGFACGWLVSRLPGVGLVMVTIAKQTLRMVPGGQCAPHPEPLPLNGDVATDHLVYPNDFSPYKPRADVVVEATAHALTGPTRYLPVSFTVGALQKRMLVAGDRTWRRGLLGHAPGEPAAFTSLPLAWTRALGGPGDAANPTGCGRTGDRMPNLEWPDRLLRGPSDRVPPAGFGAIPADWAVRRACMGTYGPDYVKKHWPWYPPDFDFGHFQAAPSDQQVQGHLRGDELLRFENLHRERAVLETRLPGLQVRWFVTMADGEFREVPQRLDTLVCDLEHDRVVLVWRGHTPVREPMLRDVVHVLAATEPLARPGSVDDYRQRRDAQATATPVAADPAIAAAAAATAAEREARLAAFAQEIAAAEAQAEAQAAALAQTLAEQGIAAGASPPPQPKGLAGVQAAPPPPATAPGAAPPPPPIGLPPAELAELQQMAADLDQPAAARGTPAWTRERVLAAVAADTDLGGQTLAGLDLSDCDLRRAKLAKADLSRCRLLRTDFAGATLAGAKLALASLDGANLHAATLDDADLTGATVAGVVWRGASLARTVLEGLALAGADLRECHGEATRFRGADLTGVQAAGAALPRANFTGCRLVGAVFVGADLGHARLHAAKVTKADFQRADLRGFRGDDGADFEGADFRHARADGAVLEFARLRGCDLRWSTWTGALLTGSDLEGSDASRADFRRASLADARLVRCRLLQTNLLRASLDRCDLTDADLRGANLYAAGLWEAKLERADLRDANVAATLLKLT